MGFQLKKFNPSDLRKHVAPEFVFGNGALTLVSQYAMNFGGRKALVVTDEGVRRAGWTGQVEEELQQAGIPYAIFDQLHANPKDYEVMAGAEFYLREKCDLIIAVGGGSPMDCAKGIGIVSTNQRDILEFSGIDAVPIPGPPLICIPTTAGSSADVSQFAILTDSQRGIKEAVISKAVVPDVALIDPQTTTTMSAELTAGVGVDALCHAMEAYVSNASSPLSDLHALEAVRLVTHYLLKAIEEPDNLVWRGQVMWGSLMAGLAFSNASLGLVHSMAHSLGGVLDLTHGECNAILLAPVIAFNFDAVPDKYRQAGMAMGLDIDHLSREAQKDMLCEALQAFRKQAGLCHSLGDLGVTRELIPQLAKMAHQDLCLVTNPVKPSIEEIERLYERAI